MEEENKYTVYMHIAPNGKRYVGITSCEDLEDRFRCRYTRHRYFHNAIKKYGWKNIKHKILATGLTKEEAIIAERKCIKHWDLRNPEKGYNISPGGNLGTKGYHHTEETKRHLSEVKTGKPFSIEARINMSRSKHGRPVCCEETGEVFPSASLAGQFLGIEKSNIKAVCRGVPNRSTAGGYHFRWASEEELGKCTIAS
jgi:predicted GIY-YIG superfamily endonuclease